MPSKDSGFGQRPMSNFAIHLTADIIGEADLLLSMTALRAAAGGGRARSLTKADRSPHSPSRDEWQAAIETDGLGRLPPLRERRARKNLGDAGARCGSRIFGKRIEGEKAVGGDFMIGFWRALLAEGAHDEERDMVAL